MSIASNSPLWLIVTGALLLSGCGQTRQFVQNHNPITRPARDRSVRYDLAQVAEREGNLRKAADEYRVLLEKKPNDAELSHRLGVVLIRLGERDEGLELLQQALRLERNDRAVLNDLGFAHLEVGELEDAERYFREALALNPNDPRTVNNLGLCAGFDGRFDEAYSHFRRVGSEAQAHANMGYVLAQRGDLSLAVSNYNRALSHDPNLRSAAEALVQLARLSEAAESTDVRIAEQRPHTEPRPRSAAPPIRQASATVETAIRTTAGHPPAAPTPAAPPEAPTLGLSTPEETEFYRPVIAE